jgi:hypothetical protein
VVYECKFEKSSPTSSVGTEYSIRRHTGRFVLCSQFNVHNRCPTKARAGSKRDDRRLHANLIHAVNSSLFPDADPDSVPDRTSPRDCHSPVTALCESCDFTLRRIYCNAWKAVGHRYIRNRGGSAADKSRDRQRKLDGFGKWHFYPAIESLPVML